MDDRDSGVVYDPLLLVKVMTMFRKTNKRLANGKSPKRYIQLANKTSCLVFFYKVWATTGYGALSTRILHKWHVKSVLERAGVL